MSLGNTDINPLCLQQINQEGHFLMIKGSLQQKDITIVGMSRSNNGPSMEEKLAEQKGETDKPTITFIHFNTASPLIKKKKQTETLMRMWEICTILLINLT